MIFITEKDHSKPLFRGYVNKIFERQVKNGGVIKTYSIGTSEKKQDGTKVYSSWYCTLIGDARKNEELLKEGTPIDVYGFKMTNVSTKQEDGTWSKPYLNINISDFEVHQFEQQQQQPTYTTTVADEELPY